MTKGTFTKQEATYIADRFWATTVDEVYKQRGEYVQCNDGTPTLWGIDEEKLTEGK